MNYNEIRYSAPDSIPKKIRKKRPMGPKQVTIFFIVTMLIFGIFGSMIQYALGMVGVAVTELFFLAVSVLYVKRRGHRLKDVFPIKKPKWSAVMGTLLLWIGAYMAMIVGNLLIYAYNPTFPSSGDSDAILGSGLNWVALFLIVAVLPPICEEAMHRGVIQYGLKQKIHNPWVMAIVIGLFFGVFHLSAAKFFFTALLGGVMGWIMYKTENMVYSSLFHLVHNASQIFLLAFSGLIAIPGAGAGTAAGAGMGTGILSGLFSVMKGNSPVTAVLTGFLAGEPDVIDIYGSTLLYSAGITCICFGLVIPLIMYAGNWLLMKDIAPRRKTFRPADPKERKQLRQKLLIATGCFVLVGMLTICLGRFLYW